jgi:hypothetical protein
MRLRGGRVVQSVCEGVSSDLWTHSAATMLNGVDQCQRGQWSLLRDS